MELTAKDLEEMLKSNKSERPAMIEFWGSWCPPCQTEKIIMDELGKKYDKQIKIVKINIDRNLRISSKYDIKRAPAYIIFRNEEIILRDVGAKLREQLEAMIKKVI